MWILGWSLTIFPDYLEAYFHSRHAPETRRVAPTGVVTRIPDFDQMAFELLSETDIDGARDKVFQMQEFPRRGIALRDAVHDSEAGRVPAFQDRVPLHFRPRRIGRTGWDAAGGAHQVISTMVRCVRLGGTRSVCVRYRTEVALLPARASHRRRARNGLQGRSP